VQPLVNAAVAKTDFWQFPEGWAPMRIAQQHLIGQETYTSKENYKL